MDKELSTRSRLAQFPELQRKRIDFPEFQSKRLLFNRLTEADVGAVYHYASNPRIVEWVSWPAHQSPLDTYRFLQSIENCLDTNQGRAFVTWAIRARDNPAVAIGALNFSQFSEISGQIDYVLAEEYWHCGLATESVQALIAWIFLHFPRIERVQAHCVTQHIASRRVMEKSGMQFEGVRRAGIKMKDHVFDLAIYAILRSEALSQ